MKIINGASVTAAGSDYPALYSALDMTIEDSSVTVETPFNCIWTDSALKIKGSSRVNVKSQNLVGYYGIGSGAGMEISDNARIAAHDCDYGLFNNGSGDISISGNPHVTLDTAYGIWNYSGGGVNISGGTLISNGSERALVYKPTLDEYVDVQVYAGADAASAVQVSPDTDFHRQHYVKICSAPKAIPPTGDGFDAPLWLCMLAVDTVGLLLISKRKRAA